MASEHPRASGTFTDVGTGPPLVFLHSFLVGPSMWRPQIEELSKSYRVLVPELPIRLSEQGSSLSLEKMADDLIASFETCNVSQPLVLIGHGSGGLLALACARKYPARFRGLILAATTGGIHLNKQSREKLRQRIAFLKRRPITEGLAAFLPSFVSQQTSQNRPELMQTIRNLATARSQELTCAYMQAIHDAPACIPLPESVRLPILVLAGEDDRIHPLAAVNDMLRALPGAQFVSIPGAGHFANLEQPQDLNNAVARFVQNLDGEESASPA